VRLALLLASALGINLGLFAAMSQMVAREGEPMLPAGAAQAVEFIRTPIPENTRERDRRRKAPPKPQQMQRVRVRAAEPLPLSASNAQLPLEALAFEVKSLIQAGAGVGGVALGETLREGAESLELETLLESELQPLSRLPAQYPPGAEMRGIEGYVTLSFRVSERGTVEDIQIVEAKPHGVFERAAERAASRWRYRPVVRGGRPVAVRTVTRMRFELKRP